MSDQQKKLVLSKDKGNYAQLNPVSAETAKNSQSVEIAQVKHGEEAGVAIPPTNEGDSEQKFLGSYYLLEIGNFGTPPASPTETGQPPPAKEEEQRPSSPGRTVLDVVGGIEVSVTRSPSSSRRPHYENVQPEEDAQAKFRSHSDPQEASPPPIPTKKRARSFRLGPYENVSLSHDQTDGSDADTVAPINISPPHPCPPELVLVQDLAPVNLSPPHPFPPEPVPVQDPAPIHLSPPHPRPLEPVQDGHHELTTTSTERTDSKDADPRRFKIAQEYYRDGYEDVMVSRLNPNYQKVVLKGRPQPTTSQQTGPYAEINDLQNGLRREVSPERHCGVWIISSRDDPFAGLVQSSSVIDKDQVPSPRGRLMSVWDENRVSEEWKSVDSVMQGVSQVIIDYESSLPAQTWQSPLEKFEEGI